MLSVLFLFPRLDNSRPQLNTKGPILKGHTRPSFPLIPKCLITSLTSRTVFCLPLHIITLPSCEGRGRRESGAGGGQGHNYNNSVLTVGHKRC